MDGTGAERRTLAFLDPRHQLSGLEWGRITWLPHPAMGLSKTMLIKLQSS